MCAALTGLHSFTGCHYTSVLVKAGKERPFTLVEKSRVLKKDFSSSAGPDVTDKTVASLEQFTWALYRFPPGNSICIASLKSFEKTFVWARSNIENKSWTERVLAAFHRVVQNYWGNVKRSTFEAKADADQPLMDGIYEIVRCSGQRLPKTSAWREYWRWQWRIDPFIRGWSIRIWRLTILRMFSFALKRTIHQYSDRSSINDVVSLMVFYFFPMLYT